MNLYIVTGENTDCNLETENLSIFESLDLAMAEIDRLNSMPKGRPYINYRWQKFKLNEPYFNF